jgi:hypothetical protein
VDTSVANVPDVVPTAVVVVAVATSKGMVTINSRAQV